MRRSMSSFISSTETDLRPSRFTRPGLVPDHRGPAVYPYADVGLQGHLTEKERQGSPDPVTQVGLDIAFHCIREDIGGAPSTEASIWKSLRDIDVSRNISDFLWKAMHNARRVGKYWQHIQVMRPAARAPSVTKPKASNTSLRNVAHRNVSAYGTWRNGSGYMATPRGLSCAWAPSLASKAQQEHDDLTPHGCIKSS